MSNYILIAIIGYLLIISIVAVAMTIADKSKAKKGQWRIPEATLLLVSALGGSVAMLATMKKIRHKTQHPKFMVGIPVIIVLQVALIGFLVYFFVLKPTI